MIKKDKKKKLVIDQKTMKTADIMFLIMIIILLILLSVAIISIISPELINNIKASLLNLFN